MPSNKAIKTVYTPHWCVAATAQVLHDNEQLCNGPQGYWSFWSYPNYIWKSAFHSSESQLKFKSAEIAVRVSYSYENYENSKVSITSYHAQIWCRCYLKRHKVTWNSMRRIPRLVTDIRQRGRICVWILHILLRRHDFNLRRKLMKSWYNFKNHLLLKHVCPQKTQSFIWQCKKCHRQKNRGITYHNNRNWWDKNQQWQICGASQVSDAWSLSRSNKFKSNHIWKRC